MWKNKPTLHLVCLNHFIFDQLILEEKLLRQSEQNICLLNMGSNPAVVMGISKKVEEEVTKLFFTSSIPLIQRFSGGGTVFIDQNTFFFTLIMNKTDFTFPAFPEKIMQAIEPIFYQFLPDIQLKENDFVIGERKIAGNAQYLTKSRALHHTSLLWDFDEKNMEFLSIPQKTPAYRQSRSHNDFLTKLKNHIKKEDLFAQFIKALNSFFQVQHSAIDKLLLAPKQSRLSTKVFDRIIGNFTETSLL